MLWRPNNPSEVRRDILMPAGTPQGVIVGAFSPLDLREVGVWRTLIRGTLGQSVVPIVLIATRWTSRERREMLSGFPPSEHAHLDFREDPDECWKASVRPTRGEQTFGAWVEGGVARLLMLGPPTDDEWDRFVDEVQAGAK
jgi:hypothetical protein